MKALISSAFLLFLFSTPALADSMNQLVFSSIHEGDPSSRVTEILGTPQEFAPSQRIEGAQAWYYTTKTEKCGFTIKDNKVAHLSCVGQYESKGKRALKAFFNGFSDGYNQSRANNINCTTHTYGNNSETHCN